MKKKVKKIPAVCLIFLAAAIAVGPALYLLWGCLARPQGFYLTFLRTPEYLLKFWNSLGVCLIIALGQLIVSCMGGLALAKYPIPFQRVFLGALVVVLLLPLQVTLVPNYLILDKLGLLGTAWALILPGIFSPFTAHFFGGLSTLKKPKGARRSSQNLCQFPRLNTLRC